MAGPAPFRYHLRALAAKGSSLRPLLVVAGTMTAAVAPILYVPVYAIERYGLAPESASTFAGVLFGVTAVFAPMLGGLGDRRTPATIVLAGCLSLILAPVIALAARAPLVVYAVHGFYALGAVATTVGGNVMLVRSVSGAQRPVAVTLYTGAMALVGAVSTAAAGIVAERFSYAWLFAASAGAGVVAAALAVIRLRGRRL